MTDEEQQALDTFRQTIDPATFSTLPHAKRVNKPWGYEIIWTPEGLPYAGKILHINAGKQLSLQIHDEKRETNMKISGDAMVMLENADGELETIVMEYGKGYDVAVGQKHRFKAGATDCDIMEVSIPETGNSYRLEDDYNRPTETEELRQQPHRGWES